jgi:hypothetical protein
LNLKIGAQINFESKCCSIYSLTQLAHFASGVAAIPLKTVSNKAHVFSIRRDKNNKIPTLNVGSNLSVGLDKGFTNEFGIVAATRLLA